MEDLRDILERPAGEEARENEKDSLRLPIPVPLTPELHEALEKVYAAAKQEIIASLRVRHQAEAHSRAALENANRHLLTAQSCLTLMGRTSKEIQERMRSWEQAAKRP